ncbi:MAG: type II toxin-antitoxin system RelE/ParE family toxin [Gammaproteobacteria bacterium]|nr:type II toxin-antitoxin system RelE/ParE family toxin [Gammaproteobacteria bacterium]
MKIKILASASQDLIDGYRFYESQAEGVGAYFLDSLYSDIDSLMISAGIHSIHFGKYHRLLSKRFPFAVYYRVENETALVYAVLDCRWRPAWIRKKLS